MQRAAIVVDSGTDLPKELLDKYSIHQVPVHVHFQGEQYRDKLDLDLDQLFEMGKGTRDFPKTSQPSSGEFIEVYEEAAKEADTIISWHISGTLSGTWAAAKAAAQQLPHLDIRVMDTQSLSMGAGLQALAAAQAAVNGSSPKEIEMVGQTVGKAMEIRLVLNTLDYVRRGGRISTIEATLGSLLNIKPMLALKGGKLVTAGKTRSRKRSLELLVESVVVDCATADGSAFVVAVGHASAQEDAGKVKEELLQRLPMAQVIPYQVGVGIGAHGGPGVLGLCYYNQ